MSLKNNTLLHTHTNKFKKINYKNVKNHNNNFKKYFTIFNITIPVCEKNHLQVKNNKQNKTLYLIHNSYLLTVIFLGRKQTSSSITDFRHILYIPVKLRTLNRSIISNTHTYPLLNTQTTLKINYKNYIYKKLPLLLANNCNIKTSTHISKYSLNTTYLILYKLLTHKYSKMKLSFIRNVPSHQYKNPHSNIFLTNSAKLGMYANFYIQTDTRSTKLKPLYSAYKTKIIKQLNYLNNHLLYKNSLTQKYMPILQKNNYACTAKKYLYNYNKLKYAYPVYKIQSYLLLIHNASFYYKNLIKNSRKLFLNEKKPTNLYKLLNFKKIIFYKNNTQRYTHNFFQKHNLNNTKTLFKKFNSIKPTTRTQKKNNVGYGKYA